MTVMFYDREGYYRSGHMLQTQSGISANRILYITDFTVSCFSWNWYFCSKYMYTIDRQVYLLIQPYIPLGSLNQVPASAGGKGRILTNAEWHCVIRYGMRVSYSGES